VSLGQSFKRVFTQGDFVIVVIVLAIAGCAFWFTAGSLQLHFKKQAVPLPKEFSTLPANMGHWHQVTKDRPLSGEIQDVLKTDKYVFRDYLDDRLVDKVIIEEIRNMPDGTEEELKAKMKRLNEIQFKQPHALVHMALTFYTGLVDTVAHIPDRCYVADGYEPVDPDMPYWNVGPLTKAGAHTAGPSTRESSAGPEKADVEKPGQLQVRFINFEDQTGSRGFVTRSVAYFFHVNGEYIAAPESVRRKLQNLFETHGYYVKVELMTVVRNRDESAKVMQDFLASVMPDVEKCLPDWNKIKGEERKPEVQKVAQK